MGESFTDRDRVMTVERRAVLEVVRDLKSRFPEKQTPLLLYSGTDSWSLAIFEIKTLRVTPVPKLEQLSIIVPADGGHLLVLDKEMPTLPGYRVQVLKSYADSSSFLLWLTPQMK
jgi:hypothetical protein